MRPDMVFVPFDQLPVHEYNPKQAMKLEEELKMRQFADDFQRAYLNILFTANWLEARVQKYLKPYNITPPQYNVLRILKGQKNRPICALAIQERMLHRTSNVTRILEKLYDKELVSKKANESNRRMIDVALTGKGLSLLEEVAADMSKEYMILEKVMGTDEAAWMSDRLDLMRDEA